MIIVKNKINQDVSFTEEMYRDILNVYKIDIKKMFSKLYGTTFTLSKREVDDKNLYFDFTTNDSRDEKVNIKVSI